MNIDQLKIMLELKAMRNFTSSPAEADSSLFQDMLNQFLSEASLIGSDSVTASATSNNNLNNVLQTYSMLPPLSPTALSHQNQALSVNTAGGNRNGVTGNIEEIIQEAAEHYQLPPKLIKAVIQQESGFNPNAVSRSGAGGLMQLMPATAQSLGVNDVFDSRQNIFAGSKYLRKMLDKYDGSIELALAAYNAGPGNVDKHGGIPPFKETINYVRKVSDSFLG